MEILRLLGEGMMSRATAENRVNSPPKSNSVSQLGTGGHKLPAGYGFDADTRR